MPLNARIDVVFSEPIDPGSLTPSGVELYQNGIPVPGQLAFGNPEQTMVTFTPAEALAAGTDYELVLRDGIRDLEGIALETVETISFSTEPGFGSIAITVRGIDTEESRHGNGMPFGGTGQWPVLITGSGPGQATLRGWTGKDGAIEFKGLAAGRWTLSLTAPHPFSNPFPDVRIYVDTVITATVLANQTVIVPDMVPRLIAPFIVIGIENCPWALSGPPTWEDWGNCDSGYWGGVDAAVDVRGIAGTATAGIHYSLFIPRDRWHVEVHGAPLGEYEVEVVPVEGKWLLLPWQSSRARLRLARGPAYVEFDYWYPRATGQPANEFEGLAFVRDGQIHVIDAGGSQVQLTNTGPGVENHSPTWSPDGQRLAFVRGRPDTWDNRDIYVMDADGSNVIQRTNGGYNEDPTWSPDGASVAFTTLEQGSAGIAVIDAAGAQGPMVLLNRPGYDAQPSWSPDGQRITFTSDWRAYDIVFDLYVVNADGTDIRPLLEGPFFDPSTDYWQSAWSPDGRRIAVVACARWSWYHCYPASSIAVIDADGSGLRVLAHAGGMAKPAWSPDGKTIAFSSRTCAECPARALRFVRVDGTGEGLIVDNGHSPSWRP